MQYVARVADAQLHVLLLQACPGVCTSTRLHTFIVNRCLASERDMFSGLMSQRMREPHRRTVKILSQHYTVLQQRRAVKKTSNTTIV